MTDATLGVIFLAAAAGGAYFINRSQNPSTAALNRKEQKNMVANRAENASMSQLDSGNIRETAAPTLEGKFGGGRMLERVVSTRLARSWRSSELPHLAALKQNVHSSPEEMLTRIQWATKSAFTDSLSKTAYIFDPDRQRPVTQGKIRSKFQISNFLN